ncbi:MAG: Fic family protein [Nitrospinales bacterium]|jgi:Fic family protein
MTPYEPDVLPLRELDYQLLFGLVGDASSELARYDGLLQGIPNPAVMLSPLTTREAVLSSKIEGTQATVDEVLEQEAGLLKEGEKYKDIQEISNYRSALFQASEYLKDYPIRLNVIRELHKTLLSGLRGQDKTPGEFRLIQNWIGREGCSIEEATFVPPNPLRLQEFLEDWEQYLGYVENNVLLQTAIIHAQFELIHPFKDGNGRIGRILIPLFLYQKKQLSQPMFYLSEYLEAHRDEYYQRLGNISEQQDWNGWIAFFLSAITHQAKENSQRVKEIMALYDEMKVKVHEVTRSQYSVYLLDAIFSKPIFSSSDLIKQFNQEYEIHEKTTPGLLRQLRDANILKILRQGSGRRPSVLCFPRLINLTEGKNIF